MKLYKYSTSLSGRYSTTNGSIISVRTEFLDRRYWPSLNVQPSLEPYKIEIFINHYLIKRI